MDRGALDTTPGGTPMPPGPSATQPLGDVAGHGIAAQTPQASTAGASGASAGASGTSAGTTADPAAGTTAEPADAASPGIPSPPPHASAPAPRRRRSSLALDLTLLGIVGVLLAAAAFASSQVLYRQFYSPSAFVERYLGMLSDGRAGDALAVAGVAVDSAELEAAGLPAEASDPLLRGAALATLTDVEIVAETTSGDTSRVTVEYSAGPYPGRTTFDIERDGQIGLAPTWRFARSPLAVIDLTVLGSMSFEVNGFEIDKRQISAAGADADPLAAMPLLVFSPGLYSVSVDTPISATPGVAVLSDSPLQATQVSVQAAATPEFVDVVQERVEGFLSGCATQEVLLPTGCPFGYPVEDRIVSSPQWSIIRQPTVSVEPDAANWKIPAVEAVAHIEVDIRSLFDGSVRRVSEDVPFLMTGTITVLPDGSASISVSGTDTR